MLKFILFLAYMILVTPIILVAALVCQIALALSDAMVWLVAAIISIPLKL